MATQYVVEQRSALDYRVFEASDPYTEDHLQCQYYQMTPNSCFGKNVRERLGKGARGKVNNVLVLIGLNELPRFPLFLNNNKSSMPTHRSSLLHQNIARSIVYHSHCSDFSQAEA